MRHRDRRAGPSPARRRSRACGEFGRARADRPPAAAADWRARAHAVPAGRAAPHSDRRSRTEAPAAQSASNSKADGPPPRAARRNRAASSRALATRPRSAARRAFTPGHVDAGRASRRSAGGSAGADGALVPAPAWRRAPRPPRRAAFPVARINGFGSGFTGPDAISVAFRSMVVRRPPAPCFGGPRLFVCHVRVSRHPRPTHHWLTAATSSPATLLLGSSASSDCFGRNRGREPRCAPAPASRSGAATSADRQ